MKILFTSKERVERYRMPVRTIFIEEGRAALKQMICSPEWNKWREGLCVLALARKITG